MKSELSDRVMAGCAVVGLGLAGYGVAQWYMDMRAQAMDLPAFIAAAKSYIPFVAGGGALIGAAAYRALLCKPEKPNDAMMR